MRWALLAFLVALLKVQALRTEPAMEFPARKSGLALQPAKDKDAHMQITQPLASEMQQDWSRLPPGAEADLRRIFNVDADVEDERPDYEYSEEQQQPKSIEQLDNAELARLSNYLIKVLQRPNIYEPPILLVKESTNELDDQPYPLELLDDLKNVAKRTRYYRRYPWKRQNSRNYQTPEYDPYNTCTLTRKDVFNLLVAVDEARQGNKSRVVNFCNRKRPASAVYTNIRFLGRRRK